MILKKGQLPIFLFLFIFVGIFSVIFYTNRNFEFILYIAVILFFVFSVLISNHKVDYPNPLLWLLAIWGILHMAGGGVVIGETRLYDLMLIPLSDQYPILRFDQAVHAYGFGTATYVMFCILKTIIRPDLNKWSAVSIVAVMAGLGAGALNEIIEFFVSIMVENSGVGGYLNTSLDLVFNLIGAIIAMIIIRMIHK